MCPLCKSSRPLAKHGFYIPSSDGKKLKRYNSFQKLNILLLRGEGDALLAKANSRAVVLIPLNGSGVSGVISSGG